MKRILGWDILRLLSFTAIAYFHFTYLLWYMPDQPNPDYSILFHYIEVFSRTISFSGFTILLLSSILWGMSKKFPSKYFYFFIILASLALSYMTSDESFELSWDIYSLLFVGFAGVQLIHYRKSLGAIGFVLLWIPFWNFRDLFNLPNWLIEPLIGICEADRGDWAIFPWVGLIWFGYALGNFTQEIRQQLGSFRLNEAPLWTPILFISLFGLGPYFYTRNGPGFACDVFTQPPYVLWAHLIWFIFIMRVCLLNQVQEFLSRQKWANWISRLMLSQKFWAAYFVHFLVIQFFRIWAEAIHSTAWIGISLFILILPTTEIIIRLGLKYFPTRKT